MKTTKKIKDLASAERTMQRIAILDAKIRKAKSECDYIIAGAKSTMQNYTEDLQLEINEAIEQLHIFADENRNSILKDGKKSVELASGTMGWRTGKPSIEVADDTADKLLQAGLQAFVKITKAPVASALLNLQDTELEKFNVKKIPAKESFYVKANEVELAKTV